MHIVSTLAAGAASPIKVFDTLIDGQEVVVAVVESVDTTGDALAPSGWLTMDFMGRHRFVNGRAGAVHFIEVTANDTTGGRVSQTFRDARHAGELSAGDAYIILVSSVACCRGVLEVLGWQRADERRHLTFRSRLAAFSRSSRIWDMILFWGCVAGFLVALWLTLCSDIPPWIGP